MGMEIKLHRQMSKQFVLQPAPVAMETQNNRNLDEKISLERLEIFSCKLNCVIRT